MWQPGPLGREGTMGHKVIYEPGGRAQEYVTENGLPGLAVNLYSGCMHGCRYCYVPGWAPWKYKEHPREAFAANCVPRKGILEHIDTECEQEGADRRVILLCFTCDPYPVECSEDVTRQALEILGKHRRHVRILTKGGSRAMRDFDLLLRNQWEFGETFTFWDDSCRQKWEPRAASVPDRVGAIRAAHEMGITTWVSLEPVIVEEESLKVMEELLPYVDFWRIGKMNHQKRFERACNWRKFLEEAEHRLAMRGEVTGRQMGDHYYIKNDLWTAAGRGERRARRRSGEGAVKRAH